MVSYFSHRYVFQFLHAHGLLYMGVELEGPPAHGSDSMHLFSPLGPCKDHTSDVEMSFQETKNVCTISYVDYCD
jgi:hypothetical protein